LKKLLLVVIIAFYFGEVSAQDTIPKMSTSYYARLMPIGVFTEAGKMSNRMFQNIEVGKTYGPLDLGVAFGKMGKSDSSYFTQLRASFDATQIGIFSSELALGVGKLFNSSTPLMLEISTTLMAQVNDDWGVGAIVGTTDLSGITAEQSRVFYGLFIRYGLLRNESGGLVTRFGKHFNHKRSFKAHSF
jgi:hypothetical protein